MNLGIAKDSFNFTYALSEKCLNEHFLNTGVRLLASQTAKVSGVILSRSSREAIAAKQLLETDNGYAFRLILIQDRLVDDSNINTAITADLTDIPNRVVRAQTEFQASLDENEDKKERYYGSRPQMTALLPWVPSQSLINRIAKTWGVGADFPSADQQSWIANRTNQRSDIQADLSEKVAEREKADSEARAEADRIAESAKARSESERADWIDQHGSAHLKMARKHGYDMQRQYAQERTAGEFPEFDLDFDSDADWKSRSAPSLEALTLLEALNKSGLPEGSTAKIVWITRRHDYDFDPEVGCIETSEEAVVIRKYLGQYDLIRYLGDPQA